MWWGRDTVIDLLLPASAISVFIPAWAVSAINQPLNSFAFLTDGVHWGTGDYRFLRNVMLLATAIGVGGLWLMESGGTLDLLWVWVVTGIWVVVRAVFGLLRIWPGIGKSVFR